VATAGTHSAMDLTEYLRDAHSAELEAVARLADAISRTARADHRVHLEAHLAQEREHADRLEARLRELRFSEGALASVVGLVRGIATGGVELVTAPLGLLRGSASPREVLENAEALAAGEAHEVARYRALERLAKRAGDEDTERLAASIQEQEEAQLELLGREIPRLADHVVGGDLPPLRERRPARKPRRQTRGRSAQRRRPAAESSAPSRRPRTHADTAGPDRAEAARIREAEREREADPEGPGPEVEIEEPWPGYDGMSATEVAQRVSGESQALRAAVRLYEGAHERREVVMRATSDA
jgi:ferritin-like metal-binding protein YciE